MHSGPLIEISCVCVASFIPKEAGTHKEKFNNINLPCGEYKLKTRVKYHFNYIYIKNNSLRPVIIKSLN